ncbi:MAG: hypothetical protein J6Y69_02705 [Treponema sp.]|nr:hypothetical protein [Treponema sp.]
MENELINTEDEQQFDSKAQYTDMARKFMTMFVIQIFLICSTFKSIIIVFAARSGMAVIYFGGIVLIVNIINSIILFSLNKYDSDFGVAGLFNILSTICSFIKLFLPDNSTALLLSLLNSVFSIFYLLRFTNAMSSRLLRADASLSESWDTYRKANINILIIAIVCAVLAFISGINILAGIVAILCALADVGLLVWELVILYKSSGAMKAFAAKPDEPPSNAAPITPLVSYDNPAE